MNKQQAQEFIRNINKNMNGFINLYNASSDKVNDAIKNNASKEVITHLLSEWMDYAYLMNHFHQWFIEMGKRSFHEREIIDDQFKYFDSHADQELLEKLLGKCKCEGTECYH